MDGILVPGGFGERGIEGKIAAVRYARENGMPYLGICLGMQVAVIEVARNLAGLEGAISTEFDTDTPHPVIALITEWQDAGRRASRSAASSPTSAARCASARSKSACRRDRSRRAVYGSDEIVERHRHRYEVNNNYREQLSRRGPACSRACRSTTWSRWSSCRTIRGSSPASSTRNSPRIRVTGIRCSTSFIARRARAQSQGELPEAAEA